MPSPHNHFPQPGRPLDALVRNAQDAEAAGIDGLAVLAGARRRLQARTGRRRLLLALPAALAASLLVCFLLFRPGGTVQASPAEVVAKARDKHLTPLDRCYRNRTEPPAKFRERFPRLDDREALLWTRGDRFRIEPSLTGSGAWGRDEHGNVWFAPTRKAGAVFAPHEIPAPLEEVLTIRTVNLGEILSRVLRDCELTRLPREADTPAGVDRIEARPVTAESRSLMRVYLEIDSQGDFVRTLAVQRRTPLGETTTTLTFVEASPQPDESYRLTGNLAPDGRVYDQTRPVPRLLFLAKERLGGIVEKTSSRSPLVCNPAERRL